MSQFYFKLDGRSKPYTIARSLPDGEDAKDWITATIADDYDIDFSVNFDAYVYDPDKKTLTPPDNTNTPTLDSLNTAVKNVNDTLVSVQTAVKAVPQVQQMVMQSSQSQVQAAATLKQLQQVAVQLTQQVAQMKQAPTDDKTATTDTTTTTDTTKQEAIIMNFPTFDDIKVQWSWGIMTPDFLGTYVQIGTITADQYKQLTGTDYVAPKNA